MRMGRDETHIRNLVSLVPHRTPPAYSSSCTTALVETTSLAALHARGHQRHATSAGRASLRITANTQSVTLTSQSLPTHPMEEYSQKLLSNDNYLIEILNYNSSWLDINVPLSCPSASMVVRSALARTFSCSYSSGPSRAGSKNMIGGVASQPIVEFGDLDEKNSASEIVVFDRSSFWVIFYSYLTLLLPRPSNPKHLPAGHCSPVIIFTVA
ncbi:hypothetical protein B0J11DRAFT_241553 [Dendryphion nanum]|uniref:Uncharacterized protein n=1 Tax=Dendryphion nanum TaxID=256645 RepID=A0A9P9CXM5_9PLEO|nr:hypothetical protein B0J11DRAFT_241553 [Dendryphion nanum]